MDCRFFYLNFQRNTDLGLQHLLCAKQVSSPQRLSCRALVVKGTYSRLFKLNGLVRLDRIEADTGSFYNGASLSRYLRYSRILTTADDEYEGVVIDSNHLPESPVAFHANLRASISLWRTKGKKGVWLEVPRGRSDLIPIALQEGFDYHHAEKGYVMLTYWIPEGPCLLPANASHTVGVAGFVINTNNEVLVVQEKYCGPDFHNCWKLPTGFTDESEDIHAGAVREVKEETGIETEFIEVMAFRHAHNVAFKKSDLLFICMLRPVSTEINIDGQEIQASKWMPLDEFVQQPIIRCDDMFNKIIGICMARLNKHYSGLAAQTFVSKFDGKSSSLYYNASEDDQATYNCITK